MKYILKLKMILLMVFLLTSCENAFEEISDKDSEAAKFYEAQKLMNESNFNEAIIIFTGMDPGFLAQRDVSSIVASAYAGRCGLDFVKMAKDIVDLDPANSIYLYLSQLFSDGTDAKINDCLQAANLMNAIGDETVRSIDENLLAAFSNLTNVGTILSRYTDLDGDDNVDATFDHCSVGSIPDIAVRQIGASTSVAVLSIAASAANLNANLEQGINDICNEDAGLAAFCTTIDPNAFSASEVNALRSALGSSELGVGSCPGSFLTCACP